MLAVGYRTRMNTVVFVLFVLIFPPLAFSQFEHNCPSNDLEGLSILASSSGELLRAAELAKLQDPAKYCEDARRARYFNVKKAEFAARGVTNLSDAGYEAAELDMNADASISSGNPWDLSFMTTHRLRRAAFDRIRGTDAVWRPKEETFDELIDYFRKPEVRTPEELRATKEMFASMDKMRTDMKADIHVKPSLLQWLKGIPLALDGVMYTACAQLTLGQIKECKESLQKISSAYMPTKRDIRIGEQNWRHFDASGRFDRGVAVAAAKILTRVKNGNMSKDDNVFDDIVSSFKESDSFTDAEAKEAALMILGLISHGGANTHMRLSPRNTQRGSALALIAGAMGYLDFLKQKQGLPLYSFPKEVEVRCDNSKPYYFWLSASLVNDLVKSGSAPKGAAAAVYTVQKYYQTHRNELSEGANGKGLERILRHQAFDPVSTIIRADLAYSAAGLAWASNLAQGKEPKSKINIDDGIRELVRKANVLPALDVSSPPATSFPIWRLAKNYYRWNQVFSPDSAFREMTKSAF
ncbi:MAG: hypothetical protein J0L82_02900 [Deltaproteobacteria bacterium]|jgi:hypothetical protein|nr:hypothetical protein [Deltaproteobacteria bacterium]